MDTTWLDRIEGAVTVCDREGRILYMNAQSGRVFQDQGGMQLMGKSLWDCHPESATAKIRKIMEEGKPNCYTIEKNGRKKVIWQSPLMENGACAGLVEIALPIPFEMPHFNRNKKKEI